MKNERLALFCDVDGVREEVQQHIIDCHEEIIRLRGELLVPREKKQPAGVVQTLKGLINIFRQQS